MEKKYQPEDYKEFRSDLAKEIQDIPKDEQVDPEKHGRHYKDNPMSERKRVLKSAKESWPSKPLFANSEFLHRQEKKFVKDLMDSGEVETNEEAEEKWREHVIEQETAVRDWAENTLCDPARLPDTILESPARLDLIAWDLRMNMPTKVAQMMENHQDISEFVEGLKCIEGEGNQTMPAYINSREKEIPNNKFLALTAEQRKYVDELTKQGEQKLGLLLQELRSKKNQELFAGSMMGFNHPTGGEYFVIARKNLQEIFGNNIPYLKFVSDTHYAIQPFGKSRNDKGNLDELNTLAAYGREDGKKLINNVEGSYKVISKIENDRAMDAKVITELGKDYSKAVKEFPELIEYMRGTGKYYEKLQEVDYENKVAVFLGGRSEWGSSGGTGYFSKVIALNGNQEQEREYQYRDRYSSANDRWEYQFGELGVKEIEQTDEGTKVIVEASAGKKKTVVNFSFKREAPREVELPELTEAEQVEFTVSVDQKINDLLGDKAGKIVGNTRWDNLQMGYSPWKGPQLKDKVLDEKHGLAAFAIIETIDYGSMVDIGTPQERCELYVISNGKLKEVDSDHAYVVQVEHPQYKSVAKNESYGDPTMTDLKIKNGALHYRSRSGEHIIDLA